MTSSSRTVCQLAALAVVLAACARHSASAPTALIGGQPVFETRTEIVTGTAVHADYFVADFNGDAKLDVAVCSLTGDLRVLLGNGSSFQEGQSSNLGGVPVWMTGGDFDADGDKDLVIVRSAADATDLWRNDGQGTFTLAATVPVGAGALAVVACDCDADGKLDFAVSRPTAPEVLYCRGDGAGGFLGILPLALPLPAGGQAFHLAAGDANRDGLADLVVSDPVVSRIVVFAGAGGGAFGEIVDQVAVPGTIGACAFGDLSGDGLPDLVLSAFNANRYVVLTSLAGNPPSVGGPSSFDVPIAGRPSLATIADVTGDGRPDLVGCIAFQASICVAPQLPQGGVGPQFQLDTSGLPLRPFVGDLDGAGNKALFALSGGGNRVNLWRQKAGNVLAGARNHATGRAGADWIAGGDFDADGDAEMLVGNEGDNELKILGPEGAGALAVAATVPIGAGAPPIEAVDLDGHGRLDVVCAVAGGLRLLRNDSTAGAYAFTLVGGALPEFGAGAFPFGIEAADVDGTPGIDLVATDFAGGNLMLLPGAGTPFAFGPMQTIAVGGSPVDVVARDFNGDGAVDLAVSRNAAANILVLSRQGGVWQPLFDIAVGNQPNYLVSADFNRDNRADLVVSNATSNAVSVLFGSATGFTRQDYAAGSAPTALLARDLTQDGNPDILVASLQSGDFRVMVGDGAGSFPLLPQFPGTLGACDAVLQDMDGDGRPDLMLASLITNRVSLVKNISAPVGGN
ncbi:MAG: FG-GAP repeat domain-containing protein [Planctomycetota bacterium]